MFNRTMKKLKTISFYSVPIVLTVAGVQGYQIRQKYLNFEKLQPPSGSTVGVEKWIDSLASDFKEKLSLDDNIEFLKHAKSVLNNIKEKLIDSNDKTVKLENIKVWMKNLLDKSTSVEESTELSDSNTSSIPLITESTQNDNYNEVALNTPMLTSCSSSSSSSSTTNNISRKKIKLLILGDSLASGVGCDESNDIPVLAKVLAKILHLTLDVDIEWKVSSIVGGTVSEFRSSLLPSLKADFLNITDSDKENTEVIAIIICGTNDWKKVFEQFPYNSKGLMSFQQELKGLIHDIRVDMTTPCHIFLPAMPFSCGHTDPNWLFGTRPLIYIMTLLRYLWDNQKQILAYDDKERKTTYVEMPTLSTPYATPGSGNISADGVHPSSKGYLWWAMHIAEAILKNELNTLNNSTIITTNTIINSSELLLLNATPNLLTIENEYEEHDDMKE